VDLMEADRVPLRKTPSNVGIVDVIITSLKNAERNLVDLSGQSYLILVLMSHTVLLRVLHLLFLALHGCTVTEREPSQKEYDGL